MRGINRVFGAFICLASLGHGAVQAQGGPIASSNISLFPAASCNSAKALPILRQRLDGKDLQTEWDGDFPWPEVLGVWTRPDRDAYAIVSAAEVPTGRWGRVKVTLKSICNDKTLAQGAKIITESDWSKEYLVLKLRNYALNGNRLSAVIKTPKLPMCIKTQSLLKLEVKIIQEGVGEDGQTISYLRDSFIADHL